MIKEDFVSFEQAKKLKALGLKSDTYKYYSVENYSEGNNPFSFDTICVGDLIDSPIICEEDDGEIIIDENYNIAAPTLSQACKWLRSKDILIHILPKSNNKYMTQVWEISSYDILETLRGEFDTYEQAQSAGVDVALGLLDERKEIETGN